MNQKAHTIANLRDCSVCTKIPDGCRDYILARPEKRTKIVSFEPPVSQVAAAGTATHALLVYLEDELVVGAYIDIKVLWNTREVEDLSEMEHDFVSLRPMPSRDPLRFPKILRMISRNLRPKVTNVEQESNDECNNEFCFSSHAADRTSTSVSKRVG
jgi:hypothetical protein